jgi:hypothetical protein
VASDCSQFHRPFFFGSSLRRRNTIKDSVAKSHALFTKIVHGFVVFMDSLGFLELVLP